MPVLSEPASHGIANLPDFTVTYVVLGAFLLVLLGIYISRRTKSMESSSSQSEKEPLMSNENNNNNNNTSSEFQSASLISEAKPRIQRPPQPPPFTPPMLEQTEMNFSSFEPAMEMPPRRRSYTKTTTDGTEVSGEIIVAEGWRRHTRVFGGGVCQACEESERRMSA